MATVLDICLKKAGRLYTEGVSCKCAAIVFQIGWIKKCQHGCILTKLEMMCQLILFKNFYKMLNDICACAAW